MIAVVCCGVWRRLFKNFTVPMLALEWTVPAHKEFWVLGMPSGPGVNIIVSKYPQDLAGGVLIGEWHMALIRLYL